MDGYIVRFVRRDNEPDETYFYNNLNDAKYHLHLFDNDNSNLYKYILLEEYVTQEIIDKIMFKGANNKMNGLIDVFNFLQEVTPITNNYDFTLFGSFYCMLLEEWCSSNNEDILNCIEIFHTQIKAVNEELGRYSLTS